MSGEFDRPAVPNRLPPMTETDPATIDEQIAAGVAEHGVFGLLNNFPQCLPGGEYRRKGMLGDAFAARLDELVVSENSPERFEVPCRHGERTLTATWRSFFADVDGAVAALVEDNKMSYDELAARQQAADTEAGQEALARYVLPVYRALRLAGYGHHDLRR